MPDLIGGYNMECIRNYELTPGAIYRNVNGTDYKCLSYACGCATMQTANAIGDWRAVNKLVWRFEAHNICKYPDGIQWDYSTGGRFAEV